jgi:DNA polymerase elongation subunit (family B)
MRILALDIETRPSLAYVWGLWDQNISLDALVESGDMICWAAKWLGKPKVEFRSVHHDGRKKMVKDAWTLLDEADAVMHFNGARFDIPHLNREFVEAGLKPPSPYKQIDLLQTVKRQFKFPSNKLAYVSKALGLEGKHSHEGYQLWIKCMAGDDKAWGRMRRYNIQDVRLLEDLYEILQPWVMNHPSVAALTGSDVCPRCGRADLVGRGYAFLRTGRYRRFCCRSCGSWTRSTKREASTTITELAA